MIDIKIKKNFFLLKYKLHYIFIVILFTASNSIITKSEGIKTSLDLIPLETDASIIEFSILKFHSNEVLFETMGSNDISEISMSNEIAIGIKNPIKQKFNIDINYKDALYDVKNLSGINLSSINTKISIFSNSGIYKFPDWKYYSIFSYNKNNLENIDCFKGKNIIVKKSNFLCAENSKTVYETVDSPIKIDGDVLSIGFGIRKKILNWEKKTTYDFGVKSNKLKFNTKFDNLFYNLNETYKEFLPQDDIWFSNNLYFGTSRSFKINENWGIGGGITLYKTWQKNYEYGETNIDTKNIKIEGKLTRNFLNNFYTSFGGFYTTNYLMGIRPSEFRRGNETLFNKGYGELNFNVGIFYNDVSKSNSINYLTDNSLDELRYSNLNQVSNKSNNILKIKKKVVKKNMKNSNTLKAKSMKLMGNQNIDLLSYALDYARKFDNSNKF